MLVNFTQILANDSLGTDHYLCSFCNFPQVHTILWGKVEYHKYIINCSMHVVKNFFNRGLKITILSMVKYWHLLTNRISMWLIMKCCFLTSTFSSKKFHAKDSHQGPLCHCKERLKTSKNNHFKNLQAFIFSMEEPSVNNFHGKFFNYQKIKSNL
jgi:hypothetical protein